MISKLIQCGKSFVIYVSLCCFLNTIFSPYLWANPPDTDGSRVSAVRSLLYADLAFPGPTSQDAIFPSDDGAGASIAGTAAKHSQSNDGAEASTAGAPETEDQGSNWKPVESRSISLKGRQTLTVSNEESMDPSGQKASRLKVYFTSLHKSLFPDLSRRTKIIIAIGSLLLGLGAAFTFGELFTDNPGTSFLFNFARNPEVLPRVTGAVAILLQSLPSIWSIYNASVQILQSAKNIKDQFSSDIYSRAQKARGIVFSAIIGGLGILSAVKHGINFYEVEINSFGPDGKPLHNYNIFGALIGPFSLANMIVIKRLLPIYHQLEDFLSRRAAAKNQFTWGKKYEDIVSSFRKLALAVNQKDSDKVVAELVEEIQRIIGTKTEPDQCMQEIFAYLYKQGNEKGPSEKEPTKAMKIGRGIAISVGSLIGVTAGALGGLNMFTKLVGANGWAIFFTLATALYTGASFARSFSEKWRNLYSKATGQYDHKTPRDAYPKTRTAIEILALAAGVYTGLPAALITSQVIYHLGHLTREQLIPWTLLFAFGYGVSDPSSDQWQNIISDLNDLKKCPDVRDHAGAARETLSRLIQFFLKNMNISPDLISALHEHLSRQEMGQRATEAKAAEQMPIHVEEVPVPTEKTTFFSGVKSKLRSWFVDPLRKFPFYPR